MSRPVRPKAKGPKEYDCAAKSRGVDDEEHEARRLARLDEDDVDGGLVGDLLDLSQEEHLADAGDGAGHHIEDARGEEPT